MGLRVLDSGLFTTVQDRGRPGRRRFGVPPGGAFDLSAFTLANALVGNDPHASALELTIRGGIYRAETSMALALTGAPMPARILDRGGPSINEIVTIPGSFTLEPGDRLELGTTQRGARTYLAVRGGWRTTIRWGSRSSEKPISDGQLLEAEPGRTWRRVPSWCAWPIPAPGSIVTIHAMDGLDGPELFAPNAGRPRDWSGLVLRVTSRSNRAGLGLQIERNGDGPFWGPSADRSSMPVIPGTLQVTGGRLVLLGPGCGTTGGYRQVAQVLTPDLSSLAQAAPGSRLRLVRVSWEEACRRDAVFRKQLARIESLGRRMNEAIRNESNERAAQMLGPLSPQRDGNRSGPSPLVGVGQLL